MYSKNVPAIVFIRYLALCIAFVHVILPPNHVLSKFQLLKRYIKTTFIHIYMYM